jgi:DNA-directed RNA polymerase subunit RPC12/RpoP
MYALWLKRATNRSYDATWTALEQTPLMNALQLTCPHCGGLFQIEYSAEGQEYACPHCAARVTAVVEPPPAASSAEPPVAEPPIAMGQETHALDSWMDPPVLAAPVSEPPVLSEPTAAEAPVLEPAPPPVGAAAQETEENPTAVVPAADTSARSDLQHKELRELSKDRESRRFLKNLIVWTFCTIVLLLILMCFLTLGS